MKITFRFQNRVQADLYRLGFQYRSWERCEAVDPGFSRMGETWVNSTSAVTAFFTGDGWVMFVSDRTNLMSRISEEELHKAESLEFAYEQPDGETAGDTGTCPHCGRTHEQLDEAAWNRWLDNFTYEDLADDMEHKMPHPRIGDIVCCYGKDEEDEDFRLDGEILFDPTWHAPCMTFYEGRITAMTSHLSLMDLFENYDVIRVRHGAPVRRVSAPLFS